VNFACLFVLSCYSFSVRKFHMLLNERSSLVTFSKCAELTFEAIY
jgi:hypothetical protein